MFRTLLIFSLIQFNTSLVFAADIGESEYNEGVKLFKNKNYPAALTYFNKSVSEGMIRNTLYFNIGVTNYKLGNYIKAEANFKRLLGDNNLRQISYYNLALIAEKRNKQKEAISWYSKSVNLNTNRKITQLTNSQLDRLLNRKTTLSSKSNSIISLAYGNDNNITRATSKSPSNKKDNYLELFTSFKTLITNNVNLKASLFSINYTSFSTENFMFYSAGFDYATKTRNWNIIPELIFTQSTLNNSNYQNILDLKVTGKHKLSNLSRIDLRYRYSNIISQNAFYNYLQGTRHQMRADYKNNTGLGKLRLRYQLELNNRQNTSTSNYSPIRNEVRIRLKQASENNWNFSEEVGISASKYGAISGFTRNDTRKRFIFSADKNIKKNMNAGIRYTYTSNESTIASEKYTKNNVQFFVDWNF